MLNPQSRLHSRWLEYLTPTLTNRSTLIHPVFNSKESYPLNREQFKISYLRNLKQTCIAIIFGSFITPWLIIAMDYIRSMYVRGIYHPIFLLETQLFCIPLLGYQLPAYFVSAFFCVSLHKRRFIKPNILCVIGEGIVGWLGGTLLLYISGPFHDITSVLGSIEFGIPSLLFFFLSKLIFQNSHWNDT